jgi:TRAP-type C4-dicarboxylate transport system permease small subunit
VTAWDNEASLNSTALPPADGGGRLQKAVVMNALVKAYDIGSFTAFLLLMGCVLIEVVTRNLLKLPTPWAEEASRFFCVWSVFLGSAAVWFRKAHIIINVLPQRLPLRPRLVLQLLTELLSAVFIICLWIGTLQIMIIQYPAKTTAMEISISYFYLGLFVGACGLVIFHGAQICETLRALCKPSQTPAQGDPS